MKKLPIFILILFLVSNLFLSSNNLVLAQGSWTPSGNVIEDIPLISDCLGMGDTVDQILCVVRKVFVIAAVVAVVVAAFNIFQAAWTFMSSGESEDKVKAARSKLMYALIGLVVAILSWAISTIIARILNL